MTDDYLTECDRQGIQPFTPAGYGYSRAWMGVPLRHHDHVLGVMVAGHGQAEVRYTPADLQLLTAVAAQAAVAVANAQLYQRIEQQANQLALINRIGRTISATLDPQEVPSLIMHELQVALDVEDGSVLLEDPATGELVIRYTLMPKPELRIPRGAGLAGKALSQGKVLIVQRSQHASALDQTLDTNSPPSTQSIICAPLSGRRLRGVIQLRNKRHGMFNTYDAQLLEAVAKQAAIALDNAELYAHTDSALAAHVAALELRNQQLTHIVALSSALRSSTDLFGVGQQIAVAIQTMTGSARVVVAVVEQEQQNIHAIAQVGLDPGIITPRRDLWTPLAIAKAALTQAQPIGNVTYRLGQHPLAAGFEDCVLLTLLDQLGKVVGIIALEQAHRTEPLSMALINQLEIVANHAAIALVNARLANEQEQTVDRLTALNALNLAFTTGRLSTDEMMHMTVRGAIGTTGGIGGGAYVHGRDGTPRQLVLDLPVACHDELLPLLEQTLEDYTILSEAELPATLIEAGVRSAMIVPVRGAKLRLGGLWIGYGDTVLPPAEREMVVLYAKTAGAVLENLRLFDQVSSARDRLASILASTAEGMLLATAQGQIAAANAAFTRLLGLGDQTLEGRAITEICEEPALANDRTQLRAICTALTAVAQGSTKGQEGEVSLTTAGQRDLAWSVLPVQSEAERHAAALLVLRDVTAERQAEKLRQDLTHMIVHDLRAPLTNMMVSIDLLLKQVSGPLTPAQQRIIQIAGGSSQQMLDLVNALLDIRRLEQRQLDLQRQPVELWELVENVFERLERIAADRSIQLRNLCAELPPINVDLDLTRRVLQNLVDNAVKFSPRGGNVDVSATTIDAAALPTEHGQGHWALISIADNGIGVPESYHTVIFELFGQAPQARGQGTGLGLAFCKLAVEAQGGTIWVENAPAGGAIFRFTVPLM